MAIASVDVDPDILREAKSTLGVKTTREAIDLALREAVMRHRQLVAIGVISTITRDLEPVTIAYGTKA
jgi:Arc/MetJ family transcription regulator